MAVVIEQGVEALLERAAAAAEDSEARLAGAEGGVCEVFQRERQGECSRGHRLLALFSFPGASAVVPNVSVPWVFAAEQDATRRRADVVSGIMGRELHSFGSQAIEIRRPDF